jgi:hypothetical protein
MIEVSFPAGLTPAEATLRDASDTRSAINADRPGLLRQRHRRH